MWHPDEGWGVIDSADTPGGCWTHFSAVLVPGLRTLDAGALVEFTYEAAGQDGYPYRAVEAWPAGRTPVRTPQVWGPSAAYTSTVTFTFGDEDESP